MFDIGFLEILVVLIIALMVIGPERMPEVARKIGQFTGKTRRFINSLKEDSEISKTINDIQTSINIEEQKQELESVRHSLQEDLGRIEKDWDVKFDQDVSRPFDYDESTPIASSQFNKAPQQPVLPKAEHEDDALPAPKDINTQPVKPSSDTQHSDKKVSQSLQPEDKAEKA